jgi:predicted dinucleotide-binding enzyme
MKIGFIGAGNMAIALGKIWARCGHEIAVSYSRDLSKLQSAADAIGPGTRAIEVGEIAAFADVIVLATGWGGSKEAIAAAGSLQNKVLWSIVNPLKADLTGVQIGTDTSAAEQIAELAVGALFVAGWPPFAEVLARGTGTINGVKPALFYCGDNAEVKETIAVLASELGTDPVDCGPLYTARMAEPALALIVQLAYGQGMGPIGYKILT